jgi:succinyldiaminopimelate transaminase
MRLNPVFESLGVYPFVRRDEAKAAAAARGIEFIDFGAGEPRERTAQFIRDAFAGATTPFSVYPKAVGLPEMRAAVCDWVQRRFDTQLDADTEVIPTLGSKEAIFHLAQIVGGDVVAITSPGYPVPERGALFAGKQVVTLPITAENHYLPDLDRVPWERLSILWLNYPNNPTGATVSPEFLQRAAALARANDAILACDEAYSELWFEGKPPASALQLEDRSNVVVFNTLSKRSSMPGYRAGFAAGDPDLIAAMKRYRPNVGVAPQEAVQRAAIAAYSDESHVEQVRDLYRAKRDVILPALVSSGLVNASGPATFFLWMQTPGPDDEEYALALLERGIVCTPGSSFGAHGSGHVRFALVPTLEDCKRAAELLSS